MLILCNVVNGVWIPFATVDDKKIQKPVEDATPVFAQGVDLRKNPPFHQIMPCPFCGTESDKTHNPLKHTREAKIKLVPAWVEPLRGMPCIIIS